jgi:hypothetical protein
MHEFITDRTRDRYPERPVPLKTKKGWAHTITTAPGTPPLRGLSLEIAFDATDDAYLSFVDEADAILHAAYQNENLGLAGWFSLRFVGHSRAYLSPQNRSSRTCMIEFAGLQELSHTRKLLARLEAAGRRHGGIQHWGMFDDLNASDVARAYPRLDTWRAVRWALANSGTLHTFDNDFTNRSRLSSGGFLPNEDWTHGALPATRGTYFADLTGDGRADAIVVNDDTVTVRLSTATGFGPTQDWTHGPFFGKRGTYFVDLTGDGKADAIVVNNDTVTVRRNTGSGFGPNEDWTHGAFFGTRGTYFVDLTGDGRADAIVVNDDTVTVRRNTGSSFGTPEDWTHGAFYGTRGTYFADLTGDGRADAIVVNDDTVTVRRAS